jgi:hypothetical protein
MVSGSVSGSHRRLWRANQRRGTRSKSAVKLADAAGLVALTMDGESPWATSSSKRAW